MNRRAFFAALLGGAAAAADPERLLWVPGRKLISIPRKHIASLFIPQQLFWLGPDGLYVFPTVEIPREECRRRWPNTPLPPRKLSRRSVTERSIPGDQERVRIEETWS